MVNSSGPARTVHVLWTGGFDSTFRVVQLSQCPVRIQPVYLAIARGSQAMELASIVKNTSRLLDHPKTKAELLPLRFIERGDIVVDDDIRNAARRIGEKEHLGGQYPELASYARNQPVMEMSIHEQAIALINKYGKLIQETDDIIGTYSVVDESQTHEDIAALFKYYRFPLATFTKLKMKSLYLEWGYEAVMHATWFCYTPIKNRPCGYCVPCMCTIDEGLKERFTRKALFRYRCKKAMIPLAPLWRPPRKFIRKLLGGGR